MVVDVAEVDDLVCVDQRLVAVRQLVEDLAHRADRAADLDQLALELEQLLDGVRGRLADHLVLDVVDGVADPVGEREVAVDQVVGDRPQQVVRPVLEDRRQAAGQVVPRPRVPVDVVDGQQEALAEHDVELGGDDDVAVAEVEQDDVDDAIGRLDLGPLVALQHVLDDQRMQSERLVRPAEACVGVGATRSTQAEQSGLSEQLGKLRQGIRAFELVELTALERDHPDRPRLPGRSGRVLPLDAHAQRDLRVRVRGRGRVRRGRGHRRPILQRRSPRSRRSRPMRRPAYASACAAGRPGRGPAGWPRR